MPKNLEPNKYSKNADIKADTPFKNFMAFIGILLMLCGMAGLAVELFSHADTLNNAWFIGQYEKTLANPMRLIYLPLIFLAYYLLSKIFAVPQGGVKPSGKGNLLMYIMMVIGIYYLVRLGLTGMIGAVDVTKLFDKF